MPRLKGATTTTSTPQPNGRVLTDLVVAMWLDGYARGLTAAGLPDDETTRRTTALRDALHQPTNLAEIRSEIHRILTPRPRTTPPIRRTP